MRFDRVDGIQFKLRKKVKELIEMKPPFPHREMFVHLSMIVVEVHFNEISSQGFKPDRERSFAEDMVVSSVETESKIW